MLKSPVKIKGSGMFLPPNRVTSEDIDRELGLPGGTTLAETGIRTRYRADEMTVSQMGAEAATEALRQAEMSFGDIDVLISATCPGQQLLPCTAALTQRELGEGDSGVPCFDVDSTCASFVTALELCGYAIAHDRYDNALIVTGSRASVGLNPKDPPTYSIFGDGAVAFVVGRADSDGESTIFGAHTETYGDLADASQVRGGGTGLLGTNFCEENREEFYFSMYGPQLCRGVIKYLQPCFEQGLEKAGLSAEEIDLVVPHQATTQAMKFFQKSVNVPPEKWMLILEDYGNCIAASIPMALHQAIGQGRLQRGDNYLLLEAAAGLSVGTLFGRF